MHLFCLFSTCIVVAVAVENVAVYVAAKRVSRLEKVLAQLGGTAAKVGKSEGGGGGGWNALKRRASGSAAVSDVEGGSPPLSMGGSKLDSMSKAVADKGDVVSMIVFPIVFALLYVWANYLPMGGNEESLACPAPLNMGVTDEAYF